MIVIEMLQFCAITRKQNQKIKKKSKKNLKNKYRKKKKN